MSKDAVTDWSTTAASNTDIGGTSIQGTAAISNFDNAFREMMAQIATHAGGAAFPGLYYDLAATLSFPASVKTLVLNGRTAFGDGAGIIPVKRTNAPVTSHNGWFRSVDRYLLNGTTNATNGGYWEFNVGDFANVKAFGAKGNGTNNDYAAIQGAIDYLDAKFGNGQVYFPGSVSAYYCPSRLVIETCVIDMFAANQAVVLHSGPSDTGLLYINRGRCHIHDLSFYGMGNTGLPVADTDSGLTATMPCVELGPLAIDVHLSRIFLRGGTGLKMGGGDNKITHCSVTRSYGTSMVDVSSGHYFLRNAMDQEWPVSLPDYQELPSTMAAWTAGEVVAVGAVRELAGFYIQCRVAGTCGGTAPALKNYTVDIADGGTVKWRLVCRNTYAAYYLGPTAQEVSISLQDISGCNTVGIQVDSSNVTLRLKLRDCILGQLMRQALLIQGGKDIKLWKNHTGVGFQKDYPAIEISGNAVGHVSIDDNFIDGGAVGILISPSSVNSVTVSANNNYMKQRVGLGTAAVAIEVAANIQNFYITNNTIDASCLQGVVVNAGTSDYYRIQNNNNQGRLSAANFIIDDGAGLNKVVEGNV